MSLTFRPAEMRDVEAVVGKASAVTREEMATCGLGKSEVLWLARSHWLNYGRAYAFLDNATVVAVFGFRPELQDLEVLTTWLISTPGFHKPKWTLFSRRFLKQIHAEFPQHRLLTTTYSRHPKVNRWFQLLGFEMLAKDDTSRRFEFVGN